jgi:hypothetical protein
VSFLKKLLIGYSPLSCRAADGPARAAPVGVNVVLRTAESRLFDATCAFATSLIWRTGAIGIRRMGQGKEGNKYQHQHFQGAIEVSEGIVLLLYKGILPTLL